MKNLSFIKHPKYDIYGLAENGEIILNSDNKNYSYRYFYDEGFDELYSYALKEMKIYPKNYKIIEIEEYLKNKYLENLMVL